MCIDWTNLKYIVFEISASPVQLDRKCTENICSSVFPRWRANEPIALKEGVLNWAVRNWDHLSPVLLFLPSCCFFHSAKRLIFHAAGCDVLCVGAEVKLRRYVSSPPLNSLFQSVWRCGVWDAGGWAGDLMSSSEVRLRWSNAVLHYRQITDALCLTMAKLL